MTDHSRFYSRYDEIIDFLGMRYWIDEGEYKKTCWNNCERLKQFGCERRLLKIAAQKNQQTRQA